MAFDSIGKHSFQIFLPVSDNIFQDNMYSKNRVGILYKLLLKLEVPWFNQINEQHKPTLIWITKVSNLLKSLTHGGWTSWHSVYSKPYTCPKLPDTHRISIWLQCYLNVLNLFFSQWSGLCYFICHLLCSIFKLHVVKSQHQASSLSTVISTWREGEGGCAAHASKCRLCLILWSVNRAYFNHILGIYLSFLRAVL